MHQLAELGREALRDQVFVGDAEVQQVFFGDVEAAAGDVDREVLQEVGDLERRADLIAESVQLLLAVTVHIEHELPDRVRRVRAVVQSLGVRAVPGLGEVHAKRREQRLERTDGDVVAADGVSQRDEDRVLNFAVVAGFEQLLPGGQCLVAAALEARLVCEVIGRAGKRVDRTDLRPQVRGQEARGHREVLVVVRRHPLAPAVAGLDGPGACGCPIGRGEAFALVIRGGFERDGEEARFGGVDHVGFPCVVMVRSDGRFGSVSKESAARGGRAKFGEEGGGALGFDLAVGDQGVGELLDLGAGGPGTQGDAARVQRHVTTLNALGGERT